MSRAALLAVTVVLSGLLAACGRQEAAPTVPPPKVQTALIPTQLAGGQLVLREDDKASAAFAKLPDNALVGDGRLYAVRQGERLVATLQISTLVPEVDLTDPKRYDEVAKKLLPGVKQELSIAGERVFEVSGEDKSTYVWFGRHLFEVLQIKGSKTPPEDVVAEIVRYQKASPAWQPLPPPPDAF